MRWVYFILLTLFVIVVQTTVGQVLWVRTPVGLVGPVFPAMVAVFLALLVRNGTDAALAAWVLGLAVDLTLSGRGMGLTALLYAAGAAGIFRVREAFFRDRVFTQVVLGFAFCLFVHGLWAAWAAAWAAGTVGFGRLFVQALGVSAYTAALTPLACRALRRIQRLLAVVPSRAERR